LKGLFKVFTRPFERPLRGILKAFKGIHKAFKRPFKDLFKVFRRSAFKALRRPFKVLSLKGILKAFNMPFKALKGTLTSLQRPLKRTEERSVGLKPFKDGQQEAAALPKGSWGGTNAGANP
jgi:hypothetical protein